MTKIRGMTRRSLGTYALGAATLPLAFGDAIAAGLISQDDRATTIAIVGAKIFPVAAPAIERGTVLVARGRIVAVGPDVAVPAGARVIEGAGRWVTPGLFNASTALGLTELAFEPAVSDNTVGAGLAAAARAWDGMNPDSVFWQPAVNEGVTSVLVRPLGGLVSGQAAVVCTHGRSREEMIRRAPAAMVVNVDGSGPLDTKTRAELWMKLRALFEDAVWYGRERGTSKRGDVRSFSADRDQLEALQPVLAGTVPAFVTASRADDILAVIELARAFKLKVILADAAEAWKVADQLAAAHIPVITTALDSIPMYYSGLGTRQDNAAILRARGVNVILTHFSRPSPWGGETFNVRNIRQQAGNAVAFGLPWDEALRSVTLAPSEAFDVASRMGSITTGKDADIVVWSGDPFEMRSRAEIVLIGGNSVKKPSRQDMLANKYRPKTIAEPNHGR
jgi:imidazolonepropionase-like amidohydrolase